MSRRELARDAMEFVTLLGKTLANTTACSIGVDAKLDRLDRMA
jgi:hypothetical protein